MTTLRNIAPIRATPRQLQSVSVYSRSQSDTVIQNVFNGISQKWPFKNTLKTTTNNSSCTILVQLLFILRSRKKLDLGLVHFFAQADFRLFGPVNDSPYIFQAKRGKKISRALSCLLSENMCKPKQTGNRWRRQQQPLQPATSSNAGWPAGRKQVGHDDK